jgi:hypothetical protein
MYAPVALFGYNRPLHLQKAIEALKKNPESTDTDLFVFIDGPKVHDQEKDAIQMCRDLALTISGFRNVTTHIQEENLGLAASIKFGVSSVLEKNDSIIVIEDDIVLSPKGLQFLNEGLARYEQEEQISSIHAYQYPIREKFDECVFLRGADCWGWATWKDRWASTTFDSKILRNQILEQNLGFEFDLDGSMQYLAMLDNQTKGKIDSWAICWHASMFLQNRFTVFPPKPLAANIGTDGSGSHAGARDIFKVFLSQDTKWVFPNKIEESTSYRQAMIEFYKENMPRVSIVIKVLKVLRRRFRPRGKVDNG